MSWIETVASRFSRNSRRKKFDFFLQSIQPRVSEKVIDVGVNDQEYSEVDNYLEKFYPYPDNITAVSKGSLTYFAARYPKVKAVISDGRRLDFPDDNFDIGYSNAVVEHVGDFPQQIQFLKELYRVSRRGYLTTPNRLFPVEVHTRVPLLHLLLSKPAFDRFLRRIGKGWAAGDYMYLLSRTELVRLLEAAGVANYRIRAHRLFFMPMTYTVTWHK